MPIDGRRIADSILSHLTTDVSALRAKGVIPTLTVILVGDNPASLSYIRQKEKAASTIGATLSLLHQPATISQYELADLVVAGNTNPSVHGLIVQRPLPESLGEASPIVCRVLPEKDVDGFVPNSFFEPPVARAVIKILEEIHSTEHLKTDLYSWLKVKKIAIIGRGETAGKPVAALLQKLECTTSIIHSKTDNPNAILKNADIIISCVGKERVITKDVVKQGAILISVGLSRNAEGKLRGDYDEKEIEDTASFYTPTPGGVGPVNVACLMENLVKATSTKISSK